jgi:hypothetical protein
MRVKSGEQKDPDGDGSPEEKTKGVVEPKSRPVRRRLHLAVRGEH